MSLDSRYHEVLRYRVEGLKKYGGRLVSDLYGPPARLAFPRIRRTSGGMESIRIGPVLIEDDPPILEILKEQVRQISGPANVLELGPGKGSMAGALQLLFGEKIARYVGIERDPSITGPYERITTLDAAPENIHLVVASEVVEHMTPDDFFSGFLEPVLPRLDASARLVVGTPNAFGPSSIVGDFTHIQAYAWYDLYALLRLSFERVDVVRTRYVWSASRLFTLPARIVLTRCLELDWCDGIVCIASGPRTDRAQRA